MRITVAIIVFAGLLAVANVGARPADVAACAPGSVTARVGGKTVCLRPGAKCKTSLDRAYHRYRFHCHRGRLTRFRPTPPRPRPVEVNVAGSAQVVVDWTTQRCDDDDVPDQPARAFRDAAGDVQLIAAHRVARRMIGPDLDHLRRECRPVMSSHGDARPDAFDDSEWVFAPYTDDGTNVYSLVHNEYHGQDHGSAWCPSGHNALCWYDAITLAFSTNGGATYTHAPAPSHLVASVPLRYIPDRAGIGYYGGTNILRNQKDGFYYAFIGVAAPGWPGGACVMRTPTLAQPDTWRFWNGSSWTGEFVNPYLVDVLDPQPRLCPPRLDVLAGSVTWNTYLGKFLLIGEKAVGQTGMFFFSLSDDLVRWTPPQLIVGVELVFTYTCGDRDPKAYASLLDAESPARNFDVTGRRGWLYYTQLNYRNCQMTLDRDLVRIPIEISGRP